MRSHRAPAAPRLPLPRGGRVDRVRLVGATLSVLGVAAFVGGLALIRGHDVSADRTASGSILRTQASAPAAATTAGDTPATTSPTAATTAPSSRTPTSQSGVGQSGVGQSGVGQSPVGQSPVTRAPAAPGTATPPPVTVLNNSTLAGLASRAADRVRSAGFPVAVVGNFRGRIVGTTVYYPPGQVQAARRLAARLPVDARVLPRFAGLPGRGLTVVVTRDYAR